MFPRYPPGFDYTRPDLWEIRPCSSVFQFLSFCLFDSRFVFPISSVIPSCPFRAFSRGFGGFILLTPDRVSVNLRRLLFV